MWSTWPSETKLLQVTFYRGTQKKVHQELLEMDVPYQSPGGQSNLCWASIVTAAHNYFNPNRPKTFHDVCRQVDDCKDTAQDVDDILGKFQISTAHLGENLKDEDTASGVKSAIASGSPVALRLERRPGNSPDEDVHFVLIVGFRDTTPTQWIVKDPSGANIGGRDVENTAVSKAMKVKYEQYTITSVVALSPAE